MEIKGKLIKKLDVESGISKAGKEWKKQSILVEQDSLVDFNTEVVIQFFGDYMKQLRDLNEGSRVDVKFNLYSREHKGRYYHNIDGYAIANLSGQETTSEVSEDDDLPF
tara:strand:- start:3697 stop:4023 length:327 start_codon:yes stop_codon:yes gene_type:complete